MMVLSTKATDIIPLYCNLSNNCCLKFVIQNTRSETIGGPKVKVPTWFTDASKMDVNAGVGIIRPNYKASIHLRKYALVLQGEVETVQVCAVINLEKGSKDATLNIKSGSQAALFFHV